MVDMPSANMKPEPERLGNSSLDVKLEISEALALRFDLEVPRLTSSRLELVIRFRSKAIKH